MRRFLYIFCYEICIRTLYLNKSCIDQDVFIFNQSGFNGLADLNDRHRDMRLDVDDMSYEELLALEERIGYVNTGLCEQTILKFLKKRKYSPCELEAAASEQEPCCICR
ncbi:probable E3 ubiquitin-protein ligase HIP1, partial [Phalaenopsis equestris]|uniref:probable E3 ubiquitin-protein ligase HIP1 n=1 Tax=Phalaenopsis equestris TaxID=78828 RepID=UPI0009E3340D